MTLKTQERKKQQNKTKIVSPVEENSNASGSRNKRMKRHRDGKNGKEEMFGTAQKQGGGEGGIRTRMKRETVVICEEPSLTGGGRKEGVMGGAVNRKMATHNESSKRLEEKAWLKEKNREPRNGRAE